MDEKFELPWPSQPSTAEPTCNLDVRKSLSETQGRLFVSHEPVEVHVAWVDREGVSERTPLGSGSQAADTVKGRPVSTFLRPNPI